MICRLTNGRAGASNPGVSLATKGVVGRVGFLDVIFASVKSFFRAVLTRSYLLIKRTAN